MLSEFFMQEGFKEIKAQISLSQVILESLNDKWWWNNRRSLFLVTDFLLTLLLIDMAHFIGALIFELIRLTGGFVFAFVIVSIVLNDLGTSWSKILSCGHTIYNFWLRDSIFISMGNFIRKYWIARFCFNDDISFYFDRRFCLWMEERCTRLGINYVRFRKRKKNTRRI